VLFQTEDDSRKRKLDATDVDDAVVTDKKIKDDGECDEQLNVTT